MVVKKIIRLSLPLVAALTIAAPIGAQIVTPITKPLMNRDNEGYEMRFLERRLNPGEWFQSPDGRFKLTYQKDGDLVLFQGASPIWRSNTAIGGKNGMKYGFDPRFVLFQNDGNFVIYHSFLSTPSQYTAVWATNTSKNRGYTLYVQDDGNVVIYDVNGKARWDTNTCCR